MKIVFLVISILFTTVANADVVSKCVPLLEQQNAAATTTGSIVELDLPDIRSLTLVAVADNDSGTLPTLDIVVESCRGSNTSYCNTIATFDQCTTGSCWTDGDQNIDMNKDSTNWFPSLRAVATLGGTTPVYDIEVYACY